MKILKKFFKKKDFVKLKLKKEKIKKEKKKKYKKKRKSLLSSVFSNCIIFVVFFNPGR